MAAAPPRPERPETGADDFAATPRTRVRRRAERGRYDRATVHAILDEALVCHVAFVADGQPFAIPTAYARDGETLYLHGSPASRMLRNLAEGVPVCVTVTLVDGVVLARSAFHHSMNYRSVVVLGRARAVEDAEERLRAMRALVEHVAAGRWGDTRRPNAKELAQTLVLALPLVEASAKVRSGPPLDGEEDLALAHWAGVIPLRVVPEAPLADPALAPGIAAPPYAERYRRPGAD
jgi:nitroimidazol reductase NimA-like FMN-containing flavoprotein (pyridoxamine 5'-phosphate oxidase superfamily)